MPFDPTYSPGTLILCRACHWIGTIDVSNALYIIIDGHLVPDLTRCPACGAKVIKEEP